MNEILQPTTRRTALQRAFAFAAGVVGVKLALPDARGEPVPPAPVPPPAAPVRSNSTTLTLYARRLHSHSSSLKPGQLPATSGKLTSRAELLEGPEGLKVGEFSGTCFGPDSLFGGGMADPSVELQTLKLKEGTLFGIGCAGPAAEGERGHAILGGTGRFAGAKGSYVIRRSPTGRGNGNVEFVITFII